LDPSLHTAFVACEEVGVILITFSLSCLLYPLCNKNAAQYFLYFTAGVDALPAKIPPQQRVFGVQQPNPKVQPPPPQAHPHYHHPTPSHQEKAPRLLSFHDQAEEEHHDNRFDQPNLNQLDRDASTTSKNLRMDGSGSGNESGGWRRECGWSVDGGGIKCPC